MSDEENQSQQTPGEIVDLWMDRAIQVKASDLHFEPDAEGMAIRMRIDGVLHLVKRVDAETGRQIVARMMVMAELHTHHMKKPQEGRADFSSEKTGGKTINLRISTFPTVWGTRAVVRFFHGLDTIPRLDELGYNDQVLDLLKKFAYQTQGMILIAGPCGSGKTTTIYSLLHHILGIRPGCSIISIEDPVEHSVDGVTQVQIGQFAGGLTYKDALKSLLRQDPQVVAIGEVRDADTAQVIMEAALTGHLLISTIHSPTVTGAMVRLLDMGLPSYQLTSAITGIVAQRLVRKLCRACRLPTGNKEEPYMPAGCAKCFKTGYRGRVPVAEAAYMGRNTRAALTNSPDVRALQDALCNDGFGTLKIDAQRVVTEGVTTAKQVGELIHTLD